MTRHVQEEASAAFDLATGPLDSGSPAEAIRRNGITSLLVTMHRIISDGWSMGVLVQEFVRLSRGRPQRCAESARAAADQYADFRKVAARLAAEAELQRQLSYWRDRLKGAPAVLELPADRPRPAVRSYRGASYDFALDAALGAQAKRLAPGSRSHAIHAALCGLGPSCCRGRAGKRW